VVSIRKTGARLVRFAGPERFGGDLALNCFVIEGGDVAVGDAVELASREDRVPSLGGAPSVTLR
jgi:hypothetical protein